MTDPKKFDVQDRRTSSREAEGEQSEGSAAAPEQAQAAGPIPEADAQAAAEAFQQEVPERQEIDFATFILSMATSAYVHLGLAKDPETQQVQRNLPLARQTIDILGILEEKTRGNLTDQEQSLLQQALFDLRMQFVEASTQGSNVGPA